MGEDSFHFSKGHKYRRGSFIHFITGDKPNSEKKMGQKFVKEQLINIRLY